MTPRPSSLPSASGGAFGTIGPVKTYRPRLTDEEMALILAALRARLAASGETRRAQIESLIERLSDQAPGNPRWRF